MNRNDMRLALATLACTALPTALAAQPQLSLQPPSQAQPQRSGEVLASELYFDAVRPGGTVSWIADPHIARYPIIFRSLRVDAQREIFAGLNEPCENCWRNGKLEQAFAGPRLLSLFSSLDIGQNADGGTELHGIFYDLRTGRRLRFTELFTSWRQAKPLIQAKFCEAFRDMATAQDWGEIACPDVDTLAFGLSRETLPSGGVAASGLEVRVPRHVASPGSIGWESVWVGGDRRIHNLMKPEYRAEVRASTSQ